MNLVDLTHNWMQWKEAERLATEERRKIEDELVKRLSVSESLDGVMTTDVENFDVKITGRIDRKVDGEKIQELAAAAGLEDHLSSLFRWKPEINMAAWKAADPKITAPLLGGITSKPGRPSFAITHKTANKKEK